MKSMPKSALFGFVALLSFVLPPVPVQADDGLPVVSYQVRPQQFVSSDFCQRLLALPEWEPFFSSATELLDKSFTRELSEDRLEGKLPDEMVADIQKCVDRGISTRRCVEAFFEHVDVIVFELRADIGAVELNSDSIAKLLRSGKIDVKVDIDGVLGTVIDVNPRRLLPVLKYLKEDKDYEFLKNEPEEFVIKFNFRFHEHKIGFCCAGAKLPGTDRYALLFSGKHDIDGYLKRFKDDKYATVSDSPVKEVVLAEPCFLFLDKQRKNAGVHSNEADFLARIKQVKVGFRDVDGVSRIDMAVTMKEAKDAQGLRDLYTGLIALVNLTHGSDSDVVKLVRSINVESDAETVVLSAKLDSPELWKTAAMLLEKTTKEIKKQL